MSLRAEIGRQWADRHGPSSRTKSLGAEWVLDQRLGLGIGFFSIGKWHPFHQCAVEHDIAFVNQPQTLKETNNNFEECMEKTILRYPDKEDVFILERDKKLFIRLVWVFGTPIWYARGWARKIKNWPLWLVERLRGDGKQ